MCNAMRNFITDSYESMISKSAKLTIIKQIHLLIHISALDGCTVFIQPPTDTAIGKMVIQVYSLPLKELNQPTIHVCPYG